MAGDDDHPRVSARAAYRGLDDEELAPWPIVAEMHDWAVLLLGNGASIAVCADFGYSSLFEQARGGQAALSAVDQAIFAALETRNFESVLRGLRTAALINDAMGLDATEHVRHYDSIRDALVEAVHAVHVPWSDVSTAALEQIKTVLLEFDSVFSTNYDLLVYWAAMCDSVPGAIPDFFWEQPLVFNPLNTEVWNKATKLLFLHGGLHLLRLSNGQTLKRTAEPGRTLLDLFGEPLAWDRDAEPLFVSEGEPEDKQAAIRSSEYLTFAFQQFSSASGPLVVFGHSLSEQDEHLVEVLRSWSGPIAIALRPADSRDILARKAELQARLRQPNLIFFDSTTHPLGDPALNAEG